MNELNGALTNFTKAIHAMGLDQSGGMQAGVPKLQQGADRLASGSRQVATGVDQLVGQVGQMGIGLNEASAFALRDTRDYYEHDIRFIIGATLIVVLLTSMVLLRAVVAPLYLVGSVVISHVAALGIGVVAFQLVLGQPLRWTVPPLAFVVPVAVGADYNMLFVSRMRDESPDGARFGVIRTLSSTGGVITAAGLIFAASMWGLLFSSITVPAIATLVGRANWWRRDRDRNGRRHSHRPGRRSKVRGGRADGSGNEETSRRSHCGGNRRRDRVFRPRDRDSR